MILNCRAAESSNLIATGTRDELAASFQTLVRISVLVCRGSRSVMAKVNSSYARPLYIGIQAAGFQIVVRRFADVKSIGLLKENIERK
jgi:hypothetical protein